MGDISIWIAIGGLIINAILLPLLKFFWNQIRDLQEDNKKLKEALDKRHEDVVSEISRIKEQFATQKHLSDTEDRITGYINIRFDDLGKKVDRTTNLIEILLNRAQSSQ